MWLLCLNSRTVFLYLCRLRLASSPTMFLFTISISYRTMLRVSRSSTVGISFMWTPLNWSGLNPSNFLMNKLNTFEVSSCSRWFLCMRRARARKRHSLTLYGCPIFSSNVRQLIFWFLSRGSGKIAFLHPVGTFLSKEASTVRFVNL